jgi:hypothetical protein
VISLPAHLPKGARATNGAGLRLQVGLGIHVATGKTDIEATCIRAGYIETSSTRLIRDTHKHTGGRAGFAYQSGKRPTANGFFKGARRRKPRGRAGFVSGLMTELARTPGGDCSIREL